MTARDYLAAVQQRAVEQRHDRHLLGTPETQAEKDRAALVAALTAALDDTEPGNLVVDEDASWVAGYLAAMRDLRAAITGTLTPKEND